MAGAWSECVKLSTITVDLQESRSVRVKVGDLLEVYLIEQAGGGYLWSRTSALPSGMTEVGERRVHDEPGIGAPSRKIFSFLCNAGFIGELHFSLARPWAPDQVEQRRTISIVCGEI